MSEPRDGAAAENRLIAGRYTVHELLGRGGMADVFRVSELATGREFALKQLLPPANERDRSSVVTLFERELHTLAQLRHPRVIAVYDYGISERGPYYTMELLDGGDLWQGTGLANTMQGADMVEAANLLGIEAMTGHWEFTYGEKALRGNLARFKGEFLAQNVFLTEEAAFNDAKGKAEDDFRGFEQKSRERRSEVERQNAVITEIRVRAAEARQRVQSDRMALDRVERGLSDLALRLTRVESELVSNVEHQGQTAAQVMLDREALGQVGSAGGVAVTALEQQ